MTQALYSRIEAIERFAADVAHELKNPLTSLRSAVETLPRAKRAEDRERERLGHVVGKWRSRTVRTWQRGTLNGGIQGAMLILLRTAVIGLAIILWQQGVAESVYSGPK